MISSPLFVVVLVISPPVSGIVSTSHHPFNHSSLPSDPRQLPRQRSIHVLHQLKVCGEENVKVNPDGQMEW